MSRLQTLNNNKENELILNTPNRLEILKEGAPINQIKTNLLGRGTYGTVIKAIYKAKPVALKIIKNLQDVNKQTALNEANILGCIHPNIVRIFKIESTPNFSIVVMERFNGHCLQKILDTIELPLMHRIFIAIDILSGLKFCHKNSILHLDIKPQNIMVQLMYPKPQDKLRTQKPYRTYKCKLCDFGSSVKQTNLNLNTTTSSTKTTKGTLRYMAPEVLKEEQLGPAADIYSLGITLWQMSYRLMPYYWLECNEVVAYQVVKHKLRPNALQTNKQEILNLSSHQNIHNNCFCQTNSTNLSYHSLENLRNILHKTKCELISEKSTEKTIESKRKPLNVLENNVNINQKVLSAKRNLQQDFVLIDTFALESVFKNNTSFEHSSQKEQLYEELFKSCWHSDFYERPQTGELLKCFKEFL